MARVVDEIASPPKANLSKALAINGWMIKMEMFCLAHFAREAQTILEIGSYKGRSARCLADNTEGKVYCVDPWLPVYFRNNNEPHEGIFPNVLSEFEKNLKDLIEIEKVHVCQGVLDNYFSKLPRMDFAFIDGDHRYAMVKKDIIDCKKLVKHEGIIAGHDYGHKEWTGVKEAVDDIFPRVNIHETIWWVKND